VRVELCVELNALHPALWAWGTWIIVNLMFNQLITYWVLLYPIVSWGLLVLVHWWFYVRNAEGLCRIREAAVESKMAA
jgi:hypothetical protein